MKIEVLAEFAAAGKAKLDLKEGKVCA